MNNKYLVAILAFLIIIIFAVDLNYKGGGIQAKHFDNGEISFDYPGNLNETNGTGSEVVSLAASDGSNITVYKQSMPPGYNLKDRVPLNGIGTIDKDFQLVSTGNITIDEITAYANNYNLQGEDGSKQRREIFFEKNNVLYSIIYTAPGEIKTGNGLSVSAAGTSGDMLNTVINSIKINDTEDNSRKMYGWAKLIMPTFGSQWAVTSRSVNDAAVYHVSTSFYPGENGQMALMGHHTTHAAPFVNINQLKAGDPLIIEDNLTQKKYTYEVVSNGDVRWGVEGVSINYQPSSVPELWLITCWPPGYSRAAWIVHSKLVSVEPLG